MKRRKNNNGTEWNQRKMEKNLQEIRNTENARYQLKIVKLDEYNDKRRERTLQKLHNGKVTEL